MLIGYGYGYPRSMQFGSNPALTAWTAFNDRATADGATAAEAAVNVCLYARFAAIFNF
jgi:hypothetical protein